MLRIGAAIIKEALDREVVKEEQAARKKAEEKAAKEAAVEKVRPGRDMMREVPASSELLFPGQDGVLRRQEGQS